MSDTIFAIPQIWIWIPIPKEPTLVGYEYTNIKAIVEHECCTWLDQNMEPLRQSDKTNRIYKRDLSIAVPLRVAGINSNQNQI